MKPGNSEQHGLDGVEPQVGRLEPELSCGVRTWILQCLELLDSVADSLDIETMRVQNGLALGVVLALASRIRLVESQREVVVGQVL